MSETIFKIEATSAHKKKLYPKRRGVLNKLNFGMLFFCVGKNFRAGVIIGRYKRN
jgi:hypothetical protein